MMGSGVDGRRRGLRRLWWWLPWLLFALSWAPVRAADADIPGSVWKQEENGWQGTWTRRGTSNVFDAVWTNGAGGRVTSVLTMSVSGNRVQIHRQDTSQRAEVDYIGTIDSNGRVQGTGTVRGTGVTHAWSASIQGSAASASTGPPPWMLEEIEYEGNVDQGQVIGTARILRTGQTFPWRANIMEPNPEPIGQLWFQFEGGWNGRWTARGPGSDIWDADWWPPNDFKGPHARAVLNVRVIDERASRGASYVRVYIRRWAVAPTSAPSASGLGSVWQQEENGWQGTWTRRGTSNVFDAVWTNGAGGRVTSVLTMSVSGNRVQIHRQDTSQRAEVDYIGTIDSNGRVQGTGTVRGTGATHAWSATIR